MCNYYTSIVFSSLFGFDKEKIFTFSRLDKTYDDLKEQNEREKFLILCCPLLTSY